jgi:hypothetical protein
MIGVTRLFTAALSASACYSWRRRARRRGCPTSALCLPPPASRGNAGPGDITLAAQLTREGSEITRGLVWRVFGPQPGPDGKLPLIASAQGGSNTFQLAPGSYLVHASFGRAGATKRITVGREGKRESIVLDAGGLKLNAVLVGGKRIAPSR